MRSFDGVALPHPLGEGLGLLLPPPLLQDCVILADAKRAVGLAAAHALLFERAVGALASPLEAETRLAGGLFFQTAAIAAGLAGGADGDAIFHVHVKGVALEGVVLAAGRLGRPHQFPPL